MKRAFSLILTVLLSMVFLAASPIAKATDSGNTDKNLHSVACLFAGREQYMTILMPYLLKLQSEGKLTEINLWQFTNNEDDIRYLDSISNLHKTSKNFTKYRTIMPKIQNNEFKLKIKAKNDAYILINNRYEIVLGGWNNTRSVIRKGIQGSRVLCETETDKILDESQYREFDIKIKDNKLMVGDLLNASIDEDEIKLVKIHTAEGSEGYWDYEETRNKNIKLFDTEKRVGWENWYEAYKYYLDYDFDLFLKIDDDIVYLDLDRYDEFVNYIVNNKDKNCVFPNMVNHGISLFYNNKQGLIPDSVIGHPYAGRKHPDTVYYYHKDGESAKKVHNYFLNNVSTFINNNMMPINMDDHKVSICMFGVLKENYDKIFNPNHIRNKDIIGVSGRAFKTTPEKFYDEVYIYSQKDNMMYPRFVVMHYQFGPQMKNGLDESFLGRYKELALNIK